MLRRGLLTFASLVLLLAAFGPPAHGAIIQTFQATGNLGLEVSAVSNLAGALPAMSGTFSLSQIPPGAMVQKAYVYSHDWASSASLNLVFGTSPVLPATPFQSDTSTIINQLYAYQWDVTPFVIPAPLSYSFTIGYAVPIGTQGNQIAGAALAVVWQDPLAPQSTVTLMAGAQQVGENTPLITDTETVTFSNLPAGSSTLYLFTASDDVLGTGETVLYNGNLVGGPIDENLGLGASLLSINTTSLAGSNTASITSPADHFGWILAATIVNPTVVSEPVVPEPGTWILFAAGLPAVLIIARRRHTNRDR